MKRPKPIEYSEWHFLANADCGACKGTGIKRAHTCPCVYRAVCRMVIDKFRELTIAPGKGQRGRVNAEYRADVYLIARRTLGKPVDWAIFRFHFLLGADWKLCARRLRIDKGTFFHRVYRIGALLGQAYLEMEPYPLFPSEAYFKRSSLAVDIAPFPPRIEHQTNGQPLRPPMRRVA